MIIEKLRNLLFFLQLKYLANPRKRVNLSINMVAHDAGISQKLKLLNFIKSVMRNLNQILRSIKESLRKN